MVFVVGLAGPANVGKSTTSRMLSKELISLDPSLKIKCTAFAQTLYEVTSLVTDIPVETLRDQNFKEIPWNSETTPIPALTGWSPRKLMQILGTECFRNHIHNEVWIQLTLSKAKNFDIVILEDARFENEYETCDVVLELKREGVKYAANHPSAMPPPPENIDLLVHLYPDMLYNDIAKFILEKRNAV